MSQLALQRVPRTSIALDTDERPLVAQLFVTPLAVSTTAAPDQG